MNFMRHQWFYSMVLVIIVHTKCGSISEKIQTKLKAHDFSIDGHFGDMYEDCDRKHTLSSISVNESKNTRNVRRIFDNLAKYLAALRSPTVNFVKRDTPNKGHIVKCLQKARNTVICFSRGKFYQFDGNLSGIVGQWKIEESNKKRAVRHLRKRFCACSLQRKNALLSRKTSNSNTSLKLQKTPNNPMSFTSAHANVLPYQEVMMEPSRRKGRPPSCYGFVAPQAALVFSRKASLGRRNSTISKNRTQVSTQRARKNGSPTQRPTTTLQSGSVRRSSKALTGTTSKFVHEGKGRVRNKRCTRRTHMLGKRSQIVSVACRPLYIPTPKPSVNEGRVAQCRIPCGAHNCGPFPTCPCRPSSRTAAPPPTTCPPIPGLAESEATLTLPTRCPPYEFTDEPCPTFECTDGCPYLTTPGCPSSSSHKAVQCPVVPINPVDKLASNIKNGVKEDSLRKTTESGRNEKNLPTRAPMTANAVNISSLEPPPKHPTVNPGAASNTDVTGKHRMGPPLETKGTQLTETKVESKLAGLWPNIDFKKLLKSAKSHYKERAEFNPRHYRIEA